MYQRFGRWSKKGVWHAVFAELVQDADFEEAFIDSTIIKAHQHAAGAQKNGRIGALPETKRTDHQDSCAGEIIRDRHGSFGPQLISRRQTRWDGFDENILSLYA